MTPSKLVFAALFPHPPIAVPEVGGERSALCHATTEGCRRLAARVVGARAERLLLVSPHAPRLRAGFGILGEGPLRGDLGDFGAPDAGFELPGDGDLARRLVHELGIEGRSGTLLSARPLDHGSTVPLVFLTRAGWSGPTAVVALPARPEPEDLTSFGRALARSMESTGSRAALVASGDMSHRLLPGAPAGYDARACEFDAAVRAVLASGRLNLAGDLAEIDPGLRELAAEDVVDSCLAVAGALPEGGSGAEVLSYEHPFGVGYLVAVLYDRNG